MSPRVVVDTDVMSYVIKGDTRAALYDKHLTGPQLCISFSTVGELYRWAVQNRWGQRRVDALRSKLQGLTVLVFDDATAWEWANVSTIKGRPVAPSDAWVAAVALRHGLPLVTHNRRHFEHVPGLTVISEA